MSGQLWASINNEIVGILRDVNGVWSIQYADEWLKSAHRHMLWECRNFCVQVV